jgi:hypothetical protein
VCVYYCRTYYKAVRVGGGVRECVEVCVFITAGPITKMFAWGEGGTREEPGTSTQGVALFSWAGL